MSTSSTTGPAARPPLHCLGGEPSPLEVVHDWARLASLPARALGTLWDLVEASLTAVDPALERRADAFCRLHEVPAEDLRSSLRVIRFLLGRAATADLSLARMTEDAAALGGGPTEAGALLLAHYDEAKSKIRRSLVEQAILEHGRVLTGLDVRVDRILGTGRSRAMGTAVGLLTLQLREGERTDRTTFYVTSEGVARLKEALQRMEELMAEERRMADEKKGPTDA